MNILLPNNGVDCEFSNCTPRIGYERPSVVLMASIQRTTTAQLSPDESSGEDRHEFQHYRPVNEGVVVVGGLGMVLMVFWDRSVLVVR